MAKTNQCSIYLYISKLKHQMIEIFMNYIIVCNNTLKDKDQYWNFNKH